MSVTSRHVFPRKTDGPLPLAVGGEGCWIKDADGKRYLDASGGAVVANLGQGRREIADAVHAQLLAGTYYHPTMFTSPPVEELADKLAAHAPEGIGRFYFLTGGAEAVETALKLARQIHLAHGRPSRFLTISRWKSYHGLTLGALSAMGRTPFRAPFAPLLGHSLHVPAPYCLRCSFGQKYPACELRCARFLEETILAAGPETVSAFLAETISGATIAAAVPPPEYWPLVREICDRHGVLLIQDEVMVGMGRTGRWFASQHYGVSPDLMTMGKGISAGALPLAAVGCREEHFRAVVEAGGFVHGGTFSHHPAAAAAGVATLGILERENLVERAAVMGEKLGGLLRARLADCPLVADVRGKGMLWGVELVADRATLAPFPRERRLTERLAHLLFERGIIVYKSTGLAGKDGDGLVIAPPFTIGEDEMEFIARELARALGEVKD